MKGPQKTPKPVLENSWITESSIGYNKQFSICDLQLKTGNMLHHLIVFNISLKD